MCFVSHEKQSQISKLKGIGSFQCGKLSSFNIIEVKEIRNLRCEIVGTH